MPSTSGPSAGPGGTHGNPNNVWEASIGFLRVDVLAGLGYLGGPVAGEWFGSGSGLVLFPVRCGWACQAGDSVGTGGRHWGRRSLLSRWRWGMIYRRTTGNLWVGPSRQRVSIGRTGGAPAFLRNQPGGSSLEPTVLPVLHREASFHNHARPLTWPLFCDNLASSVAAHL